MINYLSVLMTTYNCGKYILTSVNSILKQSFSEFEFVIIDDGSSDNTEQIICRVVDKRIRYMKIPHQGRSRALNIGLRECSSEWVALMDADDICHPFRLEKQINSMSLDENSVSCTWNVYFSNRRLLYTVETPTNKSELIKKLALHSYICNPSVIYNRNFILRNGGYDNSITTFEDYDLWLRIKDKALFNIVPEYLLFARVVSNSLSRKNFNTMKGVIYSIQKKYYDNLEANFNIIRCEEQQILKGWREYFYGNKKNARIEWNKIPKRIWSVRIIFAFLLTFTSEKILYKLQNYRLRLRLNTLVRRDKIANKEFKKTIRTINKITV